MTFSESVVHAPLHRQPGELFQPVRNDPFRIGVDGVRIPGQPPRSGISDSLSHRQAVPGDDQPGVHAPLIRRAEPEPLMTEGGQRPPDGFK